MRDRGTEAAPTASSSRRARGAAAAATGVLLLALAARVLGGSGGSGGLGGSGGPDRSDLQVVEATSRPDVTTPSTAAPAAPAVRTPDPVQAVDAGWRRLPPAPLASRTGHVAEWAGDRLVIWGGAGYDAAAGRQLPRGDGAALHRDAWSPVAAAPLAPRSQPAAVWTGGELVVWGGTDEAGHRGDGAALDPVSGRWRPLPDGPLSARSRASAVWTGDEVVVLGGVDAAGPLLDAAAYDPDEDRWRPLPSLPARADEAQDAQGVATRAGVVAWSSYRGREEPMRPLRLDPGTERWLQLPPLPPEVYRLVGLVEGDGTLYAVVETFLQPRLRLLVLPPEVATWEERAVAPGRPPSDARVHWTGDRVLVVASSGRATALAYEPSTDRWTQARPAAAPLSAGGWSQAWSGTELLLWGGTGWLEGTDPPQGGALRLPPPAGSRAAEVTTAG